MEKKLKVALIILLMILVCIVGFGGIYIKRQGALENLLPDYELGSELKGKRITKFVLDNKTNEIIKDSEGKEVEAIPDGENEENYTRENIPVNPEEQKNISNYKKTRDIINKRLKSLGVSEYNVRLDQTNGGIYIELDENKKTDTILSELFVKGKFEIIDTDDKTVLMNTEDIKEAKVLYNNTTTGISVYLTINFTKDGTKKFEKISQEYAKKEENSEENEEATDQQKTITINIDGEKFLSTSFTDVIKNGELTVSIGGASTDADTVTENITAAQQYATILNNGEIPLTYKVQTSEYIKSFNPDNIHFIVGLFIGVAVASIVYIIIRYKLLGFLISIIYIATIALTTILIRLTGIEIQYEIVASGLTILFLIDYINITILNSFNKEDNNDDKKQKINFSYKKTLNAVFALLIPAVVLTYNSSIKIANIGMTLFWGIIITLLMNLIFTKKIILTKTNK